MLIHSSSITNNLLQKLYPFQREGVEFLLKLKTAVLGFAPGLGKSLTAIAAIESSPDIHRVLILCPAILKAQWAEELKKWLPHVEYTIIEGNPASRRLAWLRTHSVTSQSASVASSKHYVIANYELLLRDSAHFTATPWDCIVADECTRISNRRGKQARVLYTLSAPYRFALTGTPITNSPVDVFGIFKFILPSLLGYWTHFIQRYAILNQWYQPDYFQNLDELRERIAPYMMIRTMEQVKLDIPAIIESDRVLAFSDEEKKLYKKLQQELLQELAQEGVLDKIEHPSTIAMSLTKLVRLRQATDSFELLGKNNASSKLEALKELLVELFGYPTIIFTEFATMARVIARDTGAEAIEGATSDTERQEILKRFREGQISLLVMTKAAQFGLNLQAARCIIHYDQCWSLSSMQQRVGRAQRIGQHNAVLVYHLLVKHSVDFYVRRILRGKQKVADRVLGSDIMAMLE